MDKDQEKIIEEDALALTGHLGKMAVSVRFAGVESLYTLGAALTRRSGPLDTLRSLLDEAGDVGLAYDSLNDRHRNFYEAQRHIELAMEAIKHAIDPED